MLERRDHDRIPRHDSYWAETIDRWKNEGLEGSWPEVLHLLQSDFNGLCWCWPVSFPGDVVTLSEDEQTKIVRDGQGKTVRWWKNRSGTPEHIAFGCDSREAWEKTYKPALIKNALQLKPEEVKQNYLDSVKYNKWTYFAGVEPFEETRSLMGDEITLMAMGEDPDWIIDVAKTFTDVTLQNYDACLATGIQPDGLWCYGDMAFNHATMCSPSMYRELIWPQHKRQVEWAHAHGMKFIYHTDGDVNGVMDLYVAAGFDCLQPLEAKASMDIRKLCPKYGQQMSFFGNIDVMLMGSNDLGRIEAEMASKIAAGKKTRGYAYHSDHSVPPTVSFETYKFIVQCLDKMGNYD